MYEQLTNTIQAFSNEITFGFGSQSKGKEVVDLLQYLCSNDVDVPVGSIIHTGMQNESGGYENDCSLTRLTDNQ